MPTRKDAKSMKVQGRFWHNRNIGETIDMDETLPQHQWLRRHRMNRQLISMCRARNAISILRK